MKKICCILFLFLVTSSIFGQDDHEYWEEWNENYHKIDVISILKFEKRYADSVEQHNDILPDYSRTDKYRFKAEYLGKKRATSKKIKTSMKNVFKAHSGNPAKLKGMMGKEVLFKVGTEEIWMPIQPQILKALKKTVKKGNVVTLYCLFLNEHTGKNELYNTLYISEFNK